MAKGILDALVERFNELCERAGCQDLRLDPEAVYREHDRERRERGGDDR